MIVDGVVNASAPLCLHLIASRNRRGAEVFAVQLVESLGRVTGRHEMLAISEGGSLNPLDVPVVGERPWNVVRGLRCAARDASVVIGHGSRGLPGASVATFGRRTPFVYRSIGDPRIWGGATRARRMRVGLQLRRAARVVALWDASARAICETFGVARSSVIVIPNGADASHFRPATPQQRAASRATLALDDRPVIAIVGSLSGEKRVRLALDACRQVTDAQVLVVGDGPEAVGVAEAVDSIGDRAQWLGSVTDVRTVLAATDLVVSASSTEGQPGALIEAALCGVPAVATDVGGTASVVGDGGALVGSDPSSREMADAITRALADTETLGRRALERASEQFSLAKVTAMWAKLLDEVVDDQ